MEIIKAIETQLGKIFNIMAFIRTAVCLIFIIGAICSCGTVEYAYSEASWVAHQIHFQEHMDIPNCQWCIDYNNPIP